MKHVLAITFACFLLGACASAANTEAMISYRTPATTFSDNSPIRGTIDLFTVSGGQDTNPLWTSEVGNDGFTDALRLSLLDHGLLAEDGGRYQLDVDLQRVKQPMLGLNMTVRSTVRYILIDKESGDTIFNKIIVAPYTAKFGDAFTGVKRLRLANEGAIRENISEFIIFLNGEAENNPMLMAQELDLVS